MSFCLLIFFLNFILEIQHREERSQQYFGSIDHNNRQQSYGNKLADEDEDEDYLRMLDQVWFHLFIYPYTSRTLLNVSEPLVALSNFT